MTLLRIPNTFVLSHVLSFLEINGGAVEDSGRSAGGYQVQTLASKTSFASCNWRSYQAASKSARTIEPTKPTNSKKLRVCSESCAGGKLSVLKQMPLAITSLIYPI